MITFVVIAIVMVAIALAWVVVPLLRDRRRASVAREASNVAILRDQLQELENDHANGTVAREQYEQARRELEQRVLEESAPASSVASSAAPRAAWRTAIAVAAIVPMAALVLYVVWGNHAAFDPSVQMASQQEHDLSPAQVNAMIEKLAAKLKNEPDNVEGWVILARTYYAMGRYGEAVPAFERATTLAPDDARLLADYADALGAKQKSLQGQPTKLIEKALQLEPTYWKALALAGTAAFDRKDYKQAVVYWEDLKKVVPDTAGMAKTLDSSIAEARELAGMPAALAGAEAPARASAMAAAAPAAPAAQASTTRSAAAAKVEGVVKLSPELVAKASPNDMVVIFARPAEGSRMPLAITQRAVKDLPVKFTLDDSMAMTPEATLSSQDRVVVGARISRKGNIMPASGDLEGISAPVKPGTSGIDVVINRTLP